MTQNGNEHAETADVGAQRVARVYAEALLNAAAKRNQVQEILDELDALVRDVFGRDPHVETFLSSAAVSRERKADAIRRAFDNRSEEILVNFLLVLNEHDRLDLLRAIRSAYHVLFDERARRIKVLVRSVVPLEEGQLNRLRERVRQAFQREPVMETRIDPDLLGGVIVRVGDWLYDASVRSRLENIRNQIIERSSHEIQSRRNRLSAD